jgi:hypothetical protein
METQLPPTPGEPKRTSRFWKYFRRSIFTIIALVILLTGAGVLLAYIYEDEIKALALKQLEKNLNTELLIDPQNIDLSIIKDFPYASLDFKEVKALDAVVAQKKDTLFKAGSIAFQFNIIDIFKENYRIKKVSIEDVQLKLWVDKKGRDNYHFLKKSKDTSSSNVAFELEKFVLKNISVSYTDQRDKSDHVFTIKDAGLKGNFSSDSYTLDTQADIFIDHLRTDSTTWVSSNPLTVQLELAVDNNSSTYTIQSSELKLADLVIDASGNVRNGGKTTQLALSLKGKDIDIQSMLSLLPGKYRDKVKDYESSGTMYMNAEVKGPVGGSEQPIITAEFGIQKGEITQVSSDVTLKNVNLKGSVTSGNSELTRNFLELEQFSATVAEGNVDGRLKIVNFNDPVIDASANANIELSDLQKFLAVDTIESINGKLKLNASFKGKIKDPKAYLADDFDNAKTTGQMTVTGASLRLKNNNLAFDSLDAYFVFHNNDVDINNFSGNVSGNDFVLRGAFRNILAWIFLEDQQLTVDASFRSRNINLEPFLKDKSEPAKKSEYKLHFSPNVNFILESEIAHLKFNKFEAADIKGTLKLKDRQFTADPVTMETMGGRVKISGSVDGTNDERLAITCDAEIKKVNVSRLFAQLDNFGQEYLTEKHLKGITSGNIQMAALCSPELEIDMKKLYARSHFTIESGELIGFKPLKEIPVYIRKDPTLFFLKVDELEKRLDHIKFAKLENDIEIRDQVITIPKMTIKSTALDMDMEFSGTHAFNGAIDYRFFLMIRELLIRRESDNAKKNTEFGMVEDDGFYHFPLYLKMVGTTEKFEIKRDKESKKDKRQQNWKDEKQNLKQILRDEFGWFKKDSTAVKKDTKEDPFNVKWDADKPADNDKKDKKKKKDDDNLDGDDF